MSHKLSVKPIPPTNINYNVYDGPVRIGTVNVVHDSMVIVKGSHQELGPLQAEISRLIAVYQPPKSVLKSGIE